MLPSTVWIIQRLPTQYLLNVMYSVLHTLKLLVKWKLQCESNWKKNKKFTLCNSYLVWKHLVCWGSNSMEYRHEYFYFSPIIAFDNILSDIPFQSHDGIFKASVSNCIKAAIFSHQGQNQTEKRESLMFLHLTPRSWNGWSPHGGGIWASLSYTPSPFFRV